jgi:hypothetical protein
MKTRLRERKGSVLLYTVALMMILLVTAGSFMKWAADEAYQARFDLARSQAYYIAQLGAIEQGMGFLRSQKIYQLDRPDHLLADGPSTQFGEFNGHYEKAAVFQQQNLYGLSESDFVKTGAWDATAVGVVELIQPDGSVAEIRSEYTLRSQMRTFANFMYLTDIETAEPPDSSGDDRIWFWGQDELFGRVHSNDYIGISGAPIFHGPVSTSKPNFIIGGGGDGAIFDYAPVFNAPEIHFPETAQDIREGAAAQGNFYADADGSLRSELIAEGGAWELRQWERGEGVVPPDGTPVETIYYTSNTIVFIDGDLYIRGNNVQQRNTIACAGNMYIVDDIVYADFDLDNPEIDPASPNILGLISESNIVVRNSEKNGWQDGGAAGENAPHNTAHVVITAGMVALGESFTFEHQNDRDNFDEPQPAPWDHGNYLFCTGSDERGIIYLRGAVAQKRRGYVHRSNCGGTGYGKNYDYDFRLQTNPPPLYLAAQDEDGNVFFEVTSSWADNPDK